MPQGIHSHSCKAMAVAMVTNGEPYVRIRWRSMTLDVH